MRETPLFQDQRWVSWHVDQEMSKLDRFITVGQREALLELRAFLLQRKPDYHSEAKQIVRREVSKILDQVREQSYDFYRQRCLRTWANALEEAEQRKADAEKENNQFNNFYVAKSQKGKNNEQQ